MSLSLKACHCCGLIQELPAFANGQSAICSRCHSSLASGVSGSVSNARTAALAVAAFVMYWPAVLLPILEIERLGHRSASSVLTGTMELFRHGSWFVGCVVLIFSVVFPLTKLVLLIELSLLRWLHRRHKAATYRLVEHVGRWSMMDVLLLALLVMLVKMGNVIEFHFGPAVIAFVLCVVLSMSASLCFDPHAIWDDESSA